MRERGGRVRENGVVAIGCSQVSIGDGVVPLAAGEIEETDVLAEGDGVGEG